MQRSTRINLETERKLVHCELVLGRPGCGPRILKLSGEVSECRYLACLRATVTLHFDSCDERLAR